MAIYEYQCSNCNTVIEKFFKISEKPQTLTDFCPHCKTQTTFKSILSPTPISYSWVRLSKVPSDLRNRFDQIRKHYPDMQSTV